MKTVADLLAKWPTDQEFARDIGADPRHVAVMKGRNRLPHWHWAKAIKGAEKRGIKGVTVDALAKIVTIRLKELV